jgi:2-polyprenyl-3-methyl-5-hydroxy-6-metoxy-1,4-benzoquinol methylase
MDIEQIRPEMRDIIERYGPWSSHSISLGDGLYTRDEPSEDAPRLRRIVQVIADLAGRPLETLRVLDLACLEGLFAIEFALRGAKVVAIEGREANIEKARFAKHVLGLDNLELVLDDVRNLDASKHGEFDVVLCLGILYHLDDDDVFRLMERVFEVCRGLAVIATHISPVASEERAWKGKKYWGLHCQEHASDAPPGERLAALWYSLDNERSFHLTRSSLYNLVENVGFTSLYECLNPFHTLWENYVTIVAIKGERQSLMASPMTNPLPEEDWPERPEDHVVKPDLKFWSGWRAGSLRSGLKGRIARLLGKNTGLKGRIARLLGKNKR